jgi:ribosomal RNA-processing protein 8
MMATKLFKESDSWGDSSGNGDDVMFSFKKTPKAKNSKKNRKANKRSHSEIDEDPEAGKYVRAPKSDEFDVPDDVSKESTVKSKKNDRKRKHEPIDNSNNNGQSSDGITPEKRLKKKHAQASADEEKRPTSFGDQLRENLKGSRFRFLNEQMYKQPGDESMKIFQEDPTAFAAYHEGYRHQIAQWPMNPLDRIIKNLKRL